MNLPVRDLVDAAYHLLLAWACLTQPEREQMERIEKHFSDLESEYETGVPVLPGWAAIGNVASRYGLDDGPFATLADDTSP